MTRKRSAALLLVSACLPLIGTCKDSTGGELSPARDVIGTWSTVIPVTFKYETDFCSDRREVVGQALWHVTFIISEAGNDPNAISVEMRYNSGSMQRTNSSCGATSSTGYFPLVSPQFMDGRVSSTAIEFSNADIEFSGSFTTDLMMGTWTHYECLLYCFGEHTDTNQLKLVKQR